MEQTQEILMGRHLRQRIAFAHKVRNSTIRENFYSGRRPNSHYRRDTTDSKVDCICRGQINSPQSKRILICLPSAQIYRQTSLLHSGQLRGTTSLKCIQSMMLTAVLANGGKPRCRRIVGASDQETFRIAPRTHPSGGRQREREGEKTGTVSSHSPRLKDEPNSWRPPGNWKRSAGLWTQ